MAYFVYLALLSIFVQNRRHNGVHPIVTCLTVTAVLFLLTFCEKALNPAPFRIFRDWFPLGLNLIAFWQLDWFTPIHYPLRWEAGWIALDRHILLDWGWRAHMAFLGSFFPAYLELTYVLVYAVAAISITIFYLLHRRDLVDRWFVLYLIGTLAAYALIPLFPSLPPRIAFPDASLDPLHSPLRAFNLAILRSGSIHAGVFPSAHVASVFAAAWGMLFVLRDRRIATLFFIYAVSVSIATVYGRYHYAADVIAGFGVSLIAAVAGLLYRRSEARKADNRNNPGRSR